MLFDLRSRGRRRVVQVVYIGLAVLIGAGLILFGVGTGSSGGGLFGAFTGSGSTKGNPAVTKAIKSATAATKANPNSAAAWAKLLVARYSAANTTGYDSTTDAYTTAGKAQLRLAGQAYTKYASLTKTPTADNATLAANAFGATEQFSKAFNVWQTILAASPGSRRALECTAVTGTAAGDTRVATLAQNKLDAIVTKTEAKEFKTELADAKKSKAYAAEAC